MSATLVYVGIGSVLAVGVAILTVAILFLRTARRYVDLAEERLELLREGEAFLLRVVARQEGLGLVSEDSREREPERGERIPELVGQPLGRRTSEESLRGFPPEAPGQQARQAPGTRGQVPSAETAERRREVAPKASAPVASTPRPEHGAPLMGVKVPHPDDDVTLRVWNGSATKYFQKKYDLYLEHYEGSVRLAERLQQMRDEAGESHDAPETQEWEDKLRRAHDAIERTTQRLDVLEQHYPELATDGDRLSARLGIARLHAGLAERFGRPR